MRERWSRAAVIVAFFAFVFMAVNQSGNMAYYIATIPVNRIDPASLSAQERALYDRIVREAEPLRTRPIDARVDPVWKAIPGLNGREVDIDRTFALAVKRKEGETIPFVFRDISPAVSLDDLGPHPVYKGNPRKPMVSLMINVAWKEENIPAMLQTLRDEGAKATFFFDGSWLERHADIARDIAAEGHELSNHAYSHKNMSALPAAAAREEIEKTQRLLEHTLGVDNRLFAPPSGDYDSETVRIANELGLTTILWTLDTVDWKEPPAQSIVRKIAVRVEPGSLILMHPTASARQALPGIIREIKRRGLLLGTVSETLSPRWPERAGLPDETEGGTR